LLGVTVMVQTQPGVDPDARDENVQSFIGVNERDASNYHARPRVTGSVAGRPAARVDGEFNNGTAYVTRDYVVFARGQAIALMARAPAPNAAFVRVLIDRIAATLRTE
jgi:hypothetical protein